MLISVLSAAVRAGTPLLYATIGEILVERSGVLNLGLEGLMLIGAFSGFVVAHLTSSLFLAVISSMIFGGIFGLIFAFLTVTMRVNQVVSGLALTMLGMGVSGFYGQKFIGKTAPQFPSISIPVLGNIPGVGTILFNHDLLVYFSYILVFAAWFYIFKTKWGMNLRAVGESPKTADSIGINVVKIRYIYIIIGAMLTSLGGAYLSLAYTSMWVEGMTAGRGWIAIALVIFSSWDPLRAMFAAYLFGGVASLQPRIQARGTTISTHLLMMLPYLLTLIILALTSGESIKKRIGAPTSLMSPYSREERE